MIPVFEGHQVILGSEGNKEPEVFQGTKEDEAQMVRSGMFLIVCALMPNPMQLSLVHWGLPLETEPDRRGRLDIS